jgi:hypothetical protein
MSTSSLEHQLKRRYCDNYGAAIGAQTFNYQMESDVGFLLYLVFTLYSM